MKMEDKLSRIKNYKTNLSVARKLNPMAEVYIKSALDTLLNEEPVDIENKIKKIKSKIRKAAENKDKTLEVELRAKWCELNFLKGG